ncbi:hypothetical protein CHUAL_001287 [Chamberlinius hualienensis]
MTTLQCTKTTVLVFGILEFMCGFVFIVFGCSWLATANNVDPSSSHNGNISRAQDNETTNIALNLIGIIFIVYGVCSIFNGIIGIVGSVKKNKPLLIIHAVVLCLGIVCQAYAVFTAFSFINLVVLIIIGLRIAVVSHLLHSLNSPVKYFTGAIQPLHLAPEQLQTNNLPIYDSLSRPSVLDTTDHHYISVPVPNSIPTNITTK